MKFNPDELLWEQKYRPQTIADCVLPESTKEYFNSIIQSGDLDNLLLSSTCPGTGKTTVARALLADMDYEYIFKAAGKGAGEGGIQAMRDIEHFASGLSLFGKRKAVIIDEADNLTDDAQSSLRNIIEQYSKTVRFILTCNFPENLMQPLRSRLREFVFEVSRQDEKSVKLQMIKRMMKICEHENIEVQEPQALAALVATHYPDNRSMVVDLKYMSKSGVIDSGSLAKIQKGTDVEPIIDALKGKDYKTLRELAPQYKHNIGKLLKSLYKSGYEKVHPSTIPHFIYAIGACNINAKTCADVEILISHMFMELMMQVKWQ